MRLTFPVQILLFVLVFMVLSWLAMHVHVSNSLASPLKKSEPAIGDVGETSLALQQAKKKLEMMQALAQESSKVIDKPSSSPVSTSSSEKGKNLRKGASSSANRPRLHAVTYASHHGRDDRFCRSVESAIRHDYDLVILGWGVKWRGLSQKLEAAHAYAASLPEHDLMLFTDAFDVLYTSEANKIVETFLSRNYSILFAAECGCWPHIMEDENICLHRYPPSPTPYRYLNSGTWIGYAKQAKEMLAEVIRLAGQNFDNANDQKLVADMFLAGTHGIKLDYQCEIFQSMHRTDPPPLPLCNPSADMHLSPEKRWFNSRTKTYPAIFHFNGGGKAHHLRMEKSVWYKESSYYHGDKWEALRHSRVTVPSRSPHGFMNFDELCPDYLRSLNPAGGM